MKTKMKIENEINKCIDGLTSESCLSLRHCRIG